MARKVLEMLSDDEVQTIHSGSIKVLERIGVEIEDENALRIFAEAGANVDSKRNGSTYPRDL